MAVVCSGELWGISYCITFALKKNHKKNMESQCYLQQHKVTQKGELKRKWVANTTKTGTDNNKNNKKRYILTHFFSIITICYIFLNLLSSAIRYSQRKKTVNIKLHFKQQKFICEWEKRLTSGLKPFVKAFMRLRVVPSSTPLQFRRTLSKAWVAHEFGIS